ncbi:MAG TPA: hypothetical protein VF175_18675, partial [Lacipirellula sp.]
MQLLLLDLAPPLAAGPRGKLRGYMPFFIANLSKNLSKNEGMKMNSAQCFVRSALILLAIASPGAVTFAQEFAPTPLY